MIIPRHATPATGGPHASKTPEEAYGATESQTGPSPVPQPEPIRTSLFELFKIGPGPSSSHTMAPMSAGYDFLERLRTLDAETIDQTQRIEVRLFGSLSATGRGHGTDRAVVAGLLGQKPGTCAPAVLDNLACGDGSSAMPLPRRSPAAPLMACLSHVIFDNVVHEFPFNNTLLLRALDARGGPVLEQEYYSVGGGFVQWKGWRAPQTGMPRHPYATMEELKAQLTGAGIRLSELMLANEQAITGQSREKILAGLDTVLEAMEASVQRGLKTHGTLPGPIGLSRKAPVLYERSRRKLGTPEGFLTAMSACAFAASEENAAGHPIVTAPTCGAAGVVPAMAHALREFAGLEQDALRKGLLAAAAIGFLARHNASVSGAEVGCQGEVGVAAAMAAAMAAHAKGKRFRIVENAAETALEHHLGMTCDPVGGFVQVPCIERNAMGVVKAYTACLIAGSQHPDAHVVGLDQVIQAMAATGRDMCTRYKETSQAGLAVAFVNC